MEGILLEWLGGPRRGSERRSGGGVLGSEPHRCLRAWTRQPDVAQVHVWERPVGGLGALRGCPERWSRCRVLGCRATGRVRPRHRQRALAQVVGWFALERLGAPRGSARFGSGRGLVG